MIVISIPTVSVHDSAGNRLFLGWNYRTKVHMNYAQLGGKGAVGRMLLQVAAQEKARSTKEQE